MEIQEVKGLIPVEWCKQRVLTSVQVSQNLNCSLDAIKMNFKNHKELYIEGVHYYKLTGEALRSFKEKYPLWVDTYTSNFYL